MYHVFNMGIGFVIIVGEDDAERTIKIIEKYNKAYKIGYVTEDRGEKIKIKTLDDSTIEL